MKLLEIQVDFFRPRWRRIAVVVFCFVWAVVEFVSISVFWGVIFVAIGLYAVQQFFLDGWPEVDETDKARSSSNNQPEK